MPEAILGNVAGAVVGGLMSDGGGGGQQTASKEPWSPAIKPLTNSLETGQGLERYYQQHPFNPMQQTGYQNLFSDLDQFRNQTAPGLMQFANKLMNTNYQRGNQQSSMGQPMQMQGSQGAAPQGLLSAMQQGPFQAPTSGNYGLLDWVQNNPFTSTDGIPKPAGKTPAEIAEEERRRREQEERDRAALLYSPGETGA